MKIELDEKDKRFINRINEDLNNKESIPLFVGQIDKDYFIKFTCKDVAKANAFVMAFMNNNNSDALLNDYGVEIKALNYCFGDNKITEIKNKVQEFINELDGMT